MPCGTCLLCREEQARQWAVRIAHQAQQHQANSFITLTYDEAHTPESGGLDYEDLTLFWKRLRKHYGELSYYAVGEYGEKTNRPHYHACIFGHDFTAGRIILKKPPNMLWTSPDLARIWGCGHVSIGALTYESARYVASYVTKKLKTKQTYRAIDESTGELVALEQPRPFMSRNIALDWWNQWNAGVRAHDRVIVNGTKQKPPKAYDRWLGAINEKELERIKQERVRKIKTESPDKTHARARNAHARAQEKNRRKSV